MACPLPNDLNADSVSEEACLHKRDECNKHIHRLPALLRDFEQNWRLLLFLASEAGGEVIERSRAVPEFRRAEHRFDDVSLGDWNRLAQGLILCQQTS